MGAALAAVLVGWRFTESTASQTNVVADLVKKKLSYLELEPEGLRQFASDYAIAMSFRYELKQRLAHPVYALTPLLDFMWSMEEPATRAALTYLMSSDFFFNGADEARLVYYVGLYDPSLVTCSNPFAKFDL
ncbi:MAG: hypothetical protein RJA70_2526 [Pseudomonadota bacterium]|jgi:hypothetical protein